MPAGKPAQKLRPRPGDGLGEVTRSGVLALAEITFVMQFLEQDQAGAAGGCHRHMLGDVGAIGIHAALVGVLQ